MQESLRNGGWHRGLGSWAGIQGVAGNRSRRAMKEGYYFC